ncbi:MAG: winged helix-turn-helix transcriptional regulator [Candidatus Thermoplasmatota archaeon]|nr:winged helix-turn-helix transcriptional regulator [Candidatus Thermoplasmatota archaeon]
MKDKIRMGIMDILYENGGDGTSFKDLARRTGIGPTKLAYHLKIICGKGLAEKRYRNEDGRRDYSFYHITSLGEMAYQSARRIYRNNNMIDASAYHDGLPDIEIIDPRTGPNCILFKVSLE